MTGTSTSWGNYANVFGPWSRLIVVSTASGKISIATLICFTANGHAKVKKEIAACG